MSPVRNRAHSKAASPSGAAGAAVSNGMRERGATLIEVLIYSALLAIFIGATLAFVASIIGSTDTLLERNEIVAAMEFMEHKLAWLAFQATGVADPAPGSSGSTLILTGADALRFPATFTIATSTVTLAFPGVTATPLANDRVTVRTFLVERYSTPQVMHALKVTITVESALYPHLVTSSTSYYAIAE